MDRVFLDANVLFSAAYSEGNSLLRFWCLPRIALLTLPYAMDEARRNLRGTGQLERLDALVVPIEKVPTMSSQPLIIELPTKELPTKELPTKELPTKELPTKDEPIFRGALAGRATHLITGDVQRFGAFFDKAVTGIWVLRPAAYLKR